MQAFNSIKSMRTPVFIVHCHVAPGSPIVALAESAFSPRAPEHSQNQSILIPGLTGKCNPGMNPGGYRIQPASWTRLHYI